MEERLLDRVTAHLGTIPGLAARNAEQIALYEIHAVIEGHTAQMATVLAAYEAWQALAAG